MSRPVSDAELYAKLYWRRFRGVILVLVPLLLVVLWCLASTFYSVEVDSEGVVLRLGRHARTTGPGLHIKLPWPIEQVHLVPVQRIQSLEFGLKTLTPGRVTVYAAPSDAEKRVALMLTGDLNLAHVGWIVQYRIKNAENYLFKIGGEADPAVAVADVIRDVSESVMRKLVGDVSVDHVITIGRDQIAGDAKVQVQEMLDSFETGIDVVTVKLQAATPPDEVKEAFDDVNRARQNKERMVNEALGERNRRIPAAHGEKDRAISEAEGYKERVVKEMRGRANAFQTRLKEYEKAPEVTRTRLYLEAMERVLLQVEHKIVLDESIRGVLPLLQLDLGDRSGVGVEGGGR